MRGEKRAQSQKARSTEDQFFMYLRVNTLNKLVPYAASRFIDNLPPFSAGNSTMRCWKMTAVSASSSSFINMWRCGMSSAIRMSSS